MNKPLDDIDQFHTSEWICALCGTIKTAGRLPDCPRCSVTQPDAVNCMYQLPEEEPKHFTHILGWWDKYQIVIAAIAGIALAICIILYTYMSNS